MIFPFHDCGEHGSQFLHIKSVVWSCHIYKDDQTPDIGGSFEVEVEETNLHDKFARAETVNRQTMMVHVHADVHIVENAELWRNWSMCLQYFRANI